MVTKDSVEKQLKNIRFNLNGWGRSEALELPHILMPDEEVYEAVNGLYEGGFALLVATDVRVLLIDKKPMNYLTVEDLRFDMINEIDYNHRLMGARISISAGSKNLKFRSYNQPKLRKLIGHVQHCMAEGKKKQTDSQQDQSQHLEQINQQLQAYLIAQHQQQEKLQKQLEQTQSGKGSKAKKEADIEPVKPSPELSDFLYAQSLLKKFNEEKSQKTGSGDTQEKQATPPEAETAIPSMTSTETPAVLPQQQKGNPVNPQMADLYAEGMEEIFGKHQQSEPASAVADQATVTTQKPTESQANSLEINPLKIAYSKLPMALRNRKFGRPSFHAHSQAEDDALAITQPVTAQ